jgi:hypothetical protein
MLLPIDDCQLPIADWLIATFHFGMPGGATNRIDAY